MKKILLFFLPVTLFAQDTFIEVNNNTRWVNEANELSFLESIDDSKNAYKAVSSSSYLFYIDLNNDYYTAEALSQERSVIRSCCMCSYTAILKNSKDTLIIEKGASDDFGNSDIVTNTFYIKNEKLVQLKLLDDDSTVVTIWDPININVQQKNLIKHPYYSNSFVPLLFREEPNINSKVLNKIKYGEKLVVNEDPLTRFDLTFDFNSYTFGDKHNSITYKKHTIYSYYVKATYKGQQGYVCFGLLSDKEPLLITNIFKFTSEVGNEVEFKGINKNLLLSENYSEGKKELNMENTPFKRIKTYQNNILVTTEFNGKSAPVTVIDIPINSRDEFYIISNNLFRYITSYAFEYLQVSKNRWVLSVSEMGPIIILQISEDEKKLSIQYELGGC